MIVERVRTICCEMGMVVVVSLATGGCRRKTVLAVLEMTGNMHVGSKRAKSQYHYQPEIYEGSIFHRLTIATLRPFFYVRIRLTSVTSKQQVTYVAIE